MVTKGLAKLKKGRLHDFSKRAKIQKKNKKKDRPHFAEGGGSR